MKFKVGNKVECIRSDAFSKKGWTGVVTEINEVGPKVKWKNGDEWRVLPKEIKLISHNETMANKKI